jgi:hypothetical protein
MSCPTSAVLSVPSLVEVGIVLALGVAMLAVASFQFTRTE